MSLKRAILETCVHVAGWFAPSRTSRPLHPSSIFVLRNNDIGDLLIVTPIFETLKRRFPSSKIVAGVGSWNFPVLENNPFVDTVMEINAPWHNKVACVEPHRSVAGMARSLSYIWRSEESRRLRDLRFDVGIDILGSQEGALLMMKAQIPWRVGVDGYAGGQTGCSLTITFDGQLQVGRAALRQAELIGAQDLAESRPQLFLTEEEKDWALQTWDGFQTPDKSSGKRLIIAPGGGLVEKCWPRENYRNLLAALEKEFDGTIAILGSTADGELGEYVRGHSNSIVNFCGRTSLRETFALIWASHGVVCNSSMILHAAAAFDKPAVATLSEVFPSARKHKMLWGYGENDLHLGCEPERNVIYSMEEAKPLIIAHLNLS